MDVPVDLPAFFNTETSDLVVPVPGVNPNRRMITNMIVKLQIDHVRRRDLLEVTLTSPQNTTVVLFGSVITGVGGDGENFGSQCLPMPNFILDDSAAQSVTTFSTFDPPVQTFIPQEPLSIFNGEEQGGLWTLRMVNGIDPGVLNCWCLEITSIPPAPIPTRSCQTPT